MRFEMRCDPAELESWRKAAGKIPLAVWVRDILNDHVVLERHDVDVVKVPEAQLQAHMREKDISLGDPVVRCPLQVPRGTVCKFCKKEHK